jgi:aspartate/methionine/tyrosine aminotransferase
MTSANASMIDPSQMPARTTARSGSEPLNRLQYFNDYWSHVNEANRRCRGRVLDMGMGMPPPDLFKTSPLLIDKLHESIDAGDYSLYMPPAGTADCLTEIVEYENSLLPPKAASYKPENVMLAPGGIQAFSLVLTVLVVKDDQILVPTPSYFSLSALSELRAHTVAVPGDLRNNFQTPAFASALDGSERARLAWFCQPNNPTGLYLSNATLDEIIDLAREHDVYVVLDESCDNYRFGPRPSLAENITDPHVVRIRTFSKDPNFAGYRLGYLLAAEHILDRFKEIAPVIYGNPTVMATRAITTEFKIRNRKIADAEHERLAAANLQLMRQARDFLYDRLVGWSRVEEVILPEACYYMFVRLDFPQGSRVLFERLLSDELLNVVPGTVFGASERDAWIRICFARHTETLLDAFERMRRVVGT